MGEARDSAAEGAGQAGGKDPKVRKTLKMSVWEGSFSSTMVGMGESFYSAFAVLLNATSTQIGILGSFPQFIGSLSQLLTARLIALFGSRKRFLVTTVLLQALMLIPIMLVFLAERLSVWLLILFATAYFFFGMISGPAWTSWMGDLVDANERGSYFGRRNKIAGIVMFLAVLVAGLLLQYFKGNDIALTGFLIIFSIAMLGRLVSCFLLWRQYEPPYVPPQHDDEGFVDFLRGMRSTNYGLLVIFLSTMNFAVAISGPYFAAYWLNDLHLSYLTYTIIMGTSLLMKYILQPVWGRAADKYGTYKVLTVTAILMPLVPVMWLFSSNFWWMMWAQVYSGFVWAGFELASFNFLLDATEPHKRAKYLSYYNVINGTLVFLGAIIGALLLKVGAVSTLFWSSFLAIFLISGILRAIVTMLFVFRLKEIRTVEHIGYRDLLFTVLSIQPNIGIRYSVEVIRENIVEPLEAGTRRIMDPLVKPIVPLVRPIHDLREEVLPTEVVKEAAELPGEVVVETVKRIEQAARDNPKQVVEDAAQVEAGVAREVTERAGVVKENVAKEVRRVKRNVRRFEESLEGVELQGIKPHVQRVHRVVKAPLHKVTRAVKPIKAKAKKLPGKLPAVVEKVKAPLRRVRGKLRRKRT